MPPRPTRRPSRLRRYLRRVAAVAALLLLAGGGGAAWLTSPWGEGSLTRLVNAAAEPALASAGLRLEVDSVGGLWQGRVHARGVRMYDAQGQWLDVPDFLLIPGPLPWSADAQGMRTVRITLVTATDAYLYRLPELPPSTAPPAAPGPLRLLTPLLRVDVADAQLAGLRLGQSVSVVKDSSALSGPADGSAANGATPSNGNSASTGGAAASAAVGDAPAATVAPAASSEVPAAQLSPQQSVNGAAQLSSGAAQGTGAAAPATPVLTLDARFHGYLEDAAAKLRVAFTLRQASQELALPPLPGDLPGDVTASMRPAATVTTPPAAGMTVGATPVGGMARSRAVAQAAFDAVTGVTLAHAAVAAPSVPRAGVNPTPQQNMALRPSAVELPVTMTAAAAAPRTDGPRLSAGAASAVRRAAAPFNAGTGLSAVAATAANTRVSAVQQGAAVTVTTTAVAPQDKAAASGQRTQPPVPSDGSAASPASAAPQGEPSPRPGQAPDPMPLTGTQLSLDWQDGYGDVRLRTRDALAYELFVRAFAPASAPASAPVSVPAANTSPQDGAAAPSAAPSASTAHSASDAAAPRFTRSTPRAPLPPANGERLDAQGMYVGQDGAITPYTGPGAVPGGFVTSDGGAILPVGAQPYGNANNSDAAGQRLWTRLRVQLWAPQWPPDAAHPLQARVAARFGLVGSSPDMRVRASLLAGRLYWDGKRFTLRDAAVAVPVRQPQVQLFGSGGLDREHGPGLRLSLHVKDLREAVLALGVERFSPALLRQLGGAVETHVDIGRGGRHSGWWLTPEPEPRQFSENPLPGLTETPGSVAAAGPSGDGPSKPVMDQASADATALPPMPDLLPVGGVRASDAPTALQGRVLLRSPSLTLPWGRVEALDLRWFASSGDVDTAPQGLVRRATEATGKTPTAAAAVAPGASGAAAASTTVTQAGASVAPPFTTAGADVGTTPSVTAGGAGDVLASGSGAEPTAADSDADDFTALGMPRVLLGTLSLQAGKLLNYGAASVQTRWMVGGMNREAQHFEARFDALSGSLPGVLLRGDLGLAYALPLKRFWPWLDGELSLRADKTPLLSQLTQGRFIGEKLDLKLRLDSLFDAQGQARQYLKADVGADLVATTDFNVRQVRGQVESLHVHALADTFSLYFNRNTGRAVIPGDSPVTPDMTLLDASLRVGTGTGGPVSWDTGDCRVRVAGENANLEARLKGSLEALLEASFNFRQRLLRVQRMQMSTLLPGDDKRQLAARLTAPAELGPEHVRLDRLECTLTGMPPLSLALNGRAEKGGGRRFLALKGDVALEGLAQGESALTATARVPLLPSDVEGTPGALWAIDAAGAVEADAAWHGSVAPFWKLAALPGRELTGQGRATGRLRGSLSAPRWSFAAGLDNGRYTDRVDGLLLDAITVDVAHDSGGASRCSLSAGDGLGGSLRLSGALEQQAGGLAVNGKGGLTRFRPLRRDDLSLTLSGNLEANGPLVWPGPLVSGEIRVDQGELKLIQGLGGGPRELEGVVRDTCAVCPPPGEGAPGANNGRAAARNAALVSTAAPAVSTAASGTVERRVSAAVPGVTPAVASDAPAAVTGTVTVNGTIEGHTHAENTPGVTRRVVSALPPKAKPKAERAVEATQSSPAGLSLLPRLDVRCVAPGRVFIRGRGLDSEWRVNIRATGRADAPELTGDLSPVRGTLDLLGREFHFAKGSIAFDGGLPPNPALDLTLDYSNPGITALVRVLGTARRPSLELTSQPPLPRDEVMAHVLFGKSMANLSRFEAIQAAAAAAQLVRGPSAFDMLSATRSLLGLEVLRVGGGRQRSTPDFGGGANATAKNGEADESTVLEAGKYIGDNIYVGLEQGMRPEEGTAVRVEVELLPNVSLTGRAGQSGSGVGLDWKMDY